MGIIITPQIRERLEAGLDFIYTARNSCEWLITDMENGTFAATDGEALQLGYPSLSICQEAIETNSIYWKGEGWYLPVAFNWESERVWCDTPEEVAQLDEDTGERFPDRPYGVKYCGSEGKPDAAEDELIRDLLNGIE